jgi:imidazolonepropionase-like amidohydrolase
MKKAGMTEMEALVSATITSAEALGIGNQVGSIDKGKLADLLVVDPDPLSNLSVLRDRSNIKMIMKNGDSVHSQFGLTEHIQN